MNFSILRSLTVLLFAALVVAGCRNEANRIQETCFDEVRNQGELRVDCGGPNCPECLPTCDDFISNQDEMSTVPNSQVTGIDCGGENCEPCSTCDDGIRNAHWVRDANLTMADLGQDSVGVSLTGILYRLVMEQAVDSGFPCPNPYIATCGDGILNGTENTIDCGPACSYGCDPACNDGIQNGNETGIDCGDAPSDEGPFCPECPDPTCDDGIQNIHIEVNEELPGGYIVVVEEGIDCDNHPLTACPDCPHPTCFDGIMNGGESGIDCGGICGTPCPDFNTCYDGVLNGAETFIDCGGPDCAPCPTCDDGIKNGPEFDVDCVDYLIPGYPCPQCPSCHNDELDSSLYELDIDCGGPNCDGCPGFLTVQIGSSNFRDQYSFNLIRAAAGQDTTDVVLPPGYPGFLVEKEPASFSGFPEHLKITANRGVDLGEDGLLIRTVIIHVPIPVDDDDVGVDYDMGNLGEPTFGDCASTFDLDENDFPFMVYREELIGGDLDECYRSYIDDGENSVMSFNYLSPDYIEVNNMFTKGTINQGSLRTAEDIFTGELQYKVFSELVFQATFNKF